ncbi:zinc finger protein 431-like isoform X2 [Pararge aegeria]|uniref:zinc finger protein 431-like isoform X2 n=1 Tax=Pararge aegeria TaxID=116150 RepID=UPI0019D0DA17|nr:zinc finger protein 431-like isoform X2 [Pararge aegeria]
MGAPNASFYYCLGCLSHKDDKLMQSYTIQNKALRAVFQEDTLNLCYICEKVAARSDRFIKNVQRNQIYLENFKSTPDSTIDTKHKFQPLVNLTSLSLEAIELTKDNEDLEKPICIIYSRDSFKVKLELKQELPLEHLEGEFIDDNDYQESSIKGEECLLQELKEENDRPLDEDINLKQLRKTLKKEKHKKKTKQTYKENFVREKNEQIIKVVHLTREQIIKDRTKMREDPKYKNLNYKCTDCIKGFNFKETYERHMLWHSKVMGEYECDICKKRMTTLDKLLGHKKYHELKHPTELAGRSFKQHICKECGAGYKNPSQLKNHMTKHSDIRDFYCVECDKGFKSSYALKQHLKIASPHVNYLELKLQCEHCDKRFGIKRDLERHLNRVHLKRKPYQCDRCDKAYVSLWPLQEHKRFAHEGHKRPLKYPCPQCDKVFAQNSTLKSHILTHTGERPYMCTYCPASFSQSSVLRTHVKLVHLRLTRDGQPKKHAVSS